MLEILETINDKELSQKLSSTSIEEGKSEVRIYLLLPGKEKKSATSTPNFFLHDFLEPLNSTNLDVERRIFETLRRKLEGFESCSKDDFPILDVFPSSKSISIGLKVLDLFESAHIIPYSIEPSLDGGVIFEYESNGTYIVFEVTNNGKILYLKDEEGTELIKQLTSKKLDKSLLNN